MKLPKRKKLIISIALTLIAAQTLFVTSANAQLSQRLSISSIAEYTVPGGDPWGTAFDGSGRVWVALPGCDLAPSCPSSTPPGKLALFDPTTQSWASIVLLPAGFGQPIFVAVDHNGKVWFTMPVTNTIGMYDPVSTTISQWAVPTPNAGPWDIAVDSKGTIWFTEHYVNKIAAFHPGTNIIQEIATPTSNSQPYGITVDASDNIWFTENPDTVALIGEYSSQGHLYEYKIRNTPTAGTGLTPHMIITDPHGNVWWSEGWASSIGMLNVAAAVPGTNRGVTEYHYTLPCSVCGFHTSGISVDRNGLIWFDDSLQNIIGSFSIGTGSFTLYRTNGHPYDGLNVDPQNRVWFDEEFANKLAVAMPPSPTPAPGTIIGLDTFYRANQTFWGTASDGQTWGGMANSNTAFSIIGNTGIISNTDSTSYTAVLGSSISNAEIYETGSMSNFSNSNFGDVLRWTDTNNWYKAYIDGTSLIIQKKVNGVMTILAAVPFTATAGTSYTIHFRVVGSTLMASVWASSGPWPNGWMATASDSSLTSGYCGMRFLVQSGTATVTSFQASAS